MATSIEDEVGEGLEGASSDVTRGALVLAEIGRLIADSTLGSEGRLSPDGSSVKELYRGPERMTGLRDLVMSIRPESVNVEAWRAWLAGGANPFGNDPLKVPKMSQHGNRNLERVTGRSRRARQAVADAERRLEEAKREAFLTDQLESAVLTHSVMEAIVSVLRPIFAMGPAWTVMRALGPEPNAERLHLDTSEIQPPERRERAVEKARQRAFDESRTMFRMLDVFAGHMQFESDLRDAVMGVVERYESRVPEAMSSGHRPRPDRAAAESVRDVDAMQSRTVVDGYEAAARP